MSIVKVEEYSEGKFKSASGYTLPFPSPADLVHEVTIGEESATSEPFAEATRFVILTASADALVVFGADPTAEAAGSIPLPAWQPRPFLVAPGWKVAVLAFAEPENEEEA